MAIKDYESMTDEQLRQMAKQNSKAWHSADAAGQDALHQANVDIYQVLDNRNGTTSTFNSKKGSWSVSGGRQSSGSGSSSASMGTGGFSYAAAPAYTSRYQEQIDALSQQILGREPFSYDAESDPAYQQYRESYTRNGKRAMEDTLGQMSARTGGLASSYAGSAAQQTYDGYMSALADKIPELRQLAYQMYQDEGNTQRANLSLLQGLEQSDYSRYLNQLGQYNTDRSFAYGVSRDQVADQRYASEWAYQLGRDQIADQRYDQQQAYQAGRDQVEDQRYDQERAYGEALDKAKLLAAAGDFSGYQALGYSQAEVANLQAAWDREQAAARLAGSYSSGGSSSRSSGGGGTDWSEADAWLGRYGSAAAENYIKEHYKDLGYSSQSAALAGWANHRLETDTITRDSELTPAATRLMQGILNHATPNLGDVKEKLAQALDSGTITEAEADYILRKVTG